MIVKRWGRIPARSFSRVTRSGVATVLVATTRVWLRSQQDRVVFDPDGNVGQLHLGLDPLTRPLDQVAAHEAEAGVGETGEQHLAGTVGPDGIVERQRGLGVHHLADRLDAEFAQHRHRHLDPGASGFAHLAGVD